MCCSFFSCCRASSDHIAVTPPPSSRRVSKLRLDRASVERVDNAERVNRVAANILSAELPPPRRVAWDQGSTSNTVSDDWTTDDLGNRKTEEDLLREEREYFQEKVENVLFLIDPSDRDYPKELALQTRGGREFTHDTQYRMSRCVKGILSTTVVAKATVLKIHSEKEEALHNNLEGWEYSLKEMDNGFREKSLRGNGPVFMKEEPL